MEHFIKVTTGEENYLTTTEQQQEEVYQNNRSNESWPSLWVGQAIIRRSNVPLSLSPHIVTHPDNARTNGMDK